MRLYKAVLKKTETEDRLCLLGSQVGDVYYVDLDAIQMLRWGHLHPRSKELVVVDRESIMIDAGPLDGRPGWLPTEFFDLPGREARTGGEAA